MKHQNAKRKISIGISFILCFAIICGLLTLSTPLNAEAISASAQLNSDFSELTIASVNIYTSMEKQVVPALNPSNYIASNGTIDLSQGRQISANKTLTFSNGAIYTGTVKSDLPDGSGKCTWPDGSTYDGAWTKGVMNGTGTYTWKNGDTYKGAFENGIVTGKGKYTIKNGPVFTGTFKDGYLIDGTITYKDKTGNSLTEKVKNGILQPTASIKMKDGTKATVPLSKGEFTGKDADITYANGDTYKGDLIRGLKDGSGTYTWKAGNHYVGGFSNDLIHGKGTYFYTKSETGKRLIGSFSNGQPSGTLTYYTTKTKYYTTTWSNGKCTSVK